MVDEIYFDKLIDIKGREGGGAGWVFSARPVGVRGYGPWWSLVVNAPEIGVYGVGLFPVRADG